MPLSPFSGSESEDSFHLFRNLWDDGSRRVLAVPISELVLVGLGEDRSGMSARSGWRPYLPFNLDDSLKDGGDAETRWEDCIRGSDGWPDD